MQHLLQKWVLLQPLYFTNESKACHLRNMHVAWVDDGRKYNRSFAYQNYPMAIAGVIVAALLWYALAEGCDRCR